MFIVSSNYWRLLQGVLQTQTTKVSPDLLKGTGEAVKYLNKARKTFGEKTVSSKTFLSLKSKIKPIAFCLTLTFPALGKTAFLLNFKFWLAHCIMSICYNFDWVKWDGVQCLTVWRRCFRLFWPVNRANFACLVQGKSQYIVELNLFHEKSQEKLGVKKNGEKVEKSFSILYNKQN